VAVTSRDLSTFQRSIKRDASGCWLWTGPTDSSGYGVIATSAGQQQVHRFSYAAHKGPIPAGLQVDHRCHTEAVQRGECSGDQDRCPHRRCANPAHLEAVTAAENTRRQDHANRRKTTCPNGHDLTDEANVHIRPSGRRTCRACDRDRKR
jgi:HNH endonuclease